MGGMGGMMGGQGMQGSQMYSMLSGLQTKKNPREENFWDMLHYSFCPTFKFMSFIFAITIINITCFILSLIFDGINLPGTFLEVNNGKILSNLAEQSRAIRVDHQVWRLMSCIFLHLNLQHISMNTFSLFIWGSIIEFLNGTPNIIILYFFSGLCGNLLSAALSDWYTYSVGASGSIMGLTGSLVGLLTLNWVALGENESLKQMRCILVVLVIIITVFSLFSGLSSVGSEVQDKN